ncbi:MAG: mandelate racemase/muconate lactonizing enzyme family protein [Planctomycetaceae bacterium]|jgi:L-alanine-DL-glutamate epimerase-like enolase superfamily enzyme|nr:mandelate racemase/muconate lactonizing enzyme family protein [Planctomycetaceae bacterium]
MQKQTDIRVKSVRCETERYDYRSPMKFGGRVVRDVVLLNVYVDVESRGGRRGTGFGSMTMGNIWAWSGGVTEPDVTLKVMIELGEKVAAAANDFTFCGHPLEVTDEFALQQNGVVENLQAAHALNEPIPKLAQLVACSPFVAAVFDAYGKMLGENVYNLLSSEFCNYDLSHYLGGDFRGEYLDAYTLRRPKPQMPLYHLVGALDPLRAGDVSEPVGDGLPEHFGEWIHYNGLTHVKIKLNGDNIDWDVNRVLEINAVAEEEQQKRGCNEWFYSADFNERCGSVEYVLEFLRKVETASPLAFQRLQYIEQPTNRNLSAFPENTMHKAAAIKPVVIDESLVDFDSLLESRRMGYSGVALKACKGHGEALLMGAAAQKFGMFLCVQDLTCPGASFLHSASLSARIPTVAAIEGNGRQYCPAANKAWQKRYPTMFNITDGTLGTAVLTGDGIY